MNQYNFDSLASHTKKELDPKFAIISSKRVCMSQWSRWFSADIESTPNRHIVHSVSGRWSPSSVPPAVSHAVWVHPPSAGLLSSNTGFPPSSRHAAASLDLECLETFNVRLGPLCFSVCLLACNVCKTHGHHQRAQWK